MTPFEYCVIPIAFLMLVWNTVEVGRNDAANLVNAVFGARILTRRTAVWLAGLGVIIGAYASSQVIETTRKEIFEPGQLQLQAALAVYVSVYIVNTILLYGYSAFGMPVSTTACLVFALLGASFSVGGFTIVHWDKAGEVIAAIIFSIFISGAAGFLVQRAIRGSIHHRGQQLSTLLMHGGWAGGGMMAGLCYFMLVKGMKKIEFVKHLNDQIDNSAYGPMSIILVLWVVFAVLIHASLIFYGKRAAKWIFPGLAIFGMMCMGFAFGQNDLANCASPGLSALNLIEKRDMGVQAATAPEIERWKLAVCGILLVVGMTTRHAQRVTRAEVNTGSMSHNVELFAPRWCIYLARRLIKLRGRAPTLAPPPIRTPTGQVMHYDAVRACVILSVSASVIATASSFGLPVSTTYVAFAAVIATGAADRILQRGDADLKLARTIWVMFSWFASAIIAAAAAGIICLAVHHLGIAGIAIGFLANMALRFILKKRSDMQEKRVREQARERMYPEEFTEYEG
jgi:phosphate/sulfate permease